MTFSGTRKKDALHNVIQHNVTQQNDSLLNYIFEMTYSIMTLGTTTFSIMTLQNDNKHDENQYNNI